MSSLFSSGRSKRGPGQPRLSPPLKLGLRNSPRQTGLFLAIRVIFLFNETEDSRRNQVLIVAFLVPGGLSN